MPKVNIDLQVKTKENKKRNCRGFIYVWSRRENGFCRLIRKKHMQAHTKAHMESSSKASNIIDWQFSCLYCFSTKGISLQSGKAEMKKKKILRSRQAHFLRTSSSDSSLPDRFVLHYSCVWLKGEHARKLRQAKCFDLSFVIRKKILLHIHIDCYTR